MKTLSLLTAIILAVSLISCEQVKQQSKAEHQRELDSFTRAKYGESADEHIKKMTDSIIAKAVFDTVGLYKAPVKVLSAKIVKQEYSTYRSVALTYKNISGKAISGIRFSWYGTNAFDEPADLGSTFAAGFGGGFTDDELKPGKSESGRWDVLSRDAKRLKIAWPTEVSFVDGTKWKLK